MSLLNDNDLVSKITAPDPVITGLAVPDDWYSKESPVQASSVDLHIGDIYVPAQIGSDEGSSDRPKQIHTLDSGQTAIISTKEFLRLPDHIAAIGYPPSRVSVRGLLMTNPGHVDPGFVGPMRFTVINMGKAKYVLKHGKPIVTLLFLELTKNCVRNWFVRNNNKEAVCPNQEDIDRLSSDFLNVTERAEKIVEKAGIALNKYSRIAAVIVALLAAVSPWLLGVQDLKTRLASLESSLSVSQIQQELENVNRRLTDLEVKPKAENDEN